MSGKNPLDTPLGDRIRFMLQAARAAGFIPATLVLDLDQRRELARERVGHGLGLRGSSHMLTNGDTFMGVPVQASPQTRMDGRFSLIVEADVKPEPTP